MTEYEVKAENLVELKSLYKSFNAYYNDMNPRTNRIFNFFTTNYGNIVDGILGDLSGFQEQTEALIDTVEDTIYAMQEVMKLETVLENLKFKKEFITNKLLPGW